MTTLPTDDFDSLSDWAASHNLGRSAGVGAALSAFRQDLTALLRDAAAGRREYAERLTGNDPASREVVDGLALDLESEARQLETVIRLVEGDLSAMTAWLPSWRWTDEMTTAVETKEGQ